MGIKDILLFPLACAVMTLLGILLLFKPEWFWKLENFLDTKGGEPSEWYETKSRLLGAVCLILGIGGALALLMLTAAGLLLSI